MKFIAAREMRNHYQAVIRQLKPDEDIVLTTKGKPVALLSGINEKNFEERLARRRGERAGEALARAGAYAKRVGTDTLSDAEIQAEIDVVRRSKAVRR
jgi:antitoxin (DNA-binding transcriptional repressor) of toxin-antitoxin stability system